MRNCKDIKHVYSYSCGNVNSMKLFEKSIVSECRIREVPTEKGIDKKYCDDIYLLFHQKRLENLGIDTINNWLKSLTPQSDALSSLRSKCTDEELLSLVKSRHIQSQSELLAWSNYLEQNYSALLEKVQTSGSAAVDDASSSAAVDISGSATATAVQ